MLILPAIDLINGKCVRLSQGDYDQVKQYSISPLEVTHDFQKAGAEFLHIVDLDGAKEGKTSNLEIVLEIAKNTKMPIQIGGGIRNFTDAKKYLDKGIQRLILGTSVIENLGLLQKIVKEYDSSRVIVSLDIFEENIAVKGWREVTKISLWEVLEDLKKIGIKMIILTDIKRDGMLDGPNFDLIQKVMQKGIEVIVAGGVSRIEDIRKLKNLNVYGAIIGKALYEGRIDLAEAVNRGRVSLNSNSNLAKRIIPCMDIKDGRVVKGVNFVGLKDAGDPVELAKLYSEQGADELVFLDIMATVEKRSTFCELVQEIAKNINIPFTVGGGISSLDDIQELLQSGADKVSLGSIAVKNPNLVKEASTKFGAQCVVISVDPKKVGESWEIYIKGGREGTGIDALKFAKEMEELGAGELLVNSLDRDGTKNGYDLELLKAISEAVNIPVIASSGAGKKEDFLEAFQKTNVDAVLAASLFHSGEILVGNLKQYLSDSGVKIRI